MVELKSIPRTFFHRYNSRRFVWYFIMYFVRVRFLIVFSTVDGYRSQIILNNIINIKWNNIKFNIICGTDCNRGNIDNYNIYLYIYICVHNAGGRTLEICSNRQTRQSVCDEIKTRTDCKQQNEIKTPTLFINKTTSKVRHLRRRRRRSYHDIPATRYAVGEW